MASIQQIPLGRWRVQLFVKGKRTSCTFKNKDDADLWAKKMEASLSRKANDKFVSDDPLEPSLLKVSSIPKRVLTALGKVPFSLDEVLDAAIPSAEMVGIYFLIRGDEVVYVGQSSVDILARVAKHKREGKQFDSFSFVKCNKSQLNEMESNYISAFIPVLNVSFGRFG